MERYDNYEKTLIGQPDLHNNPPAMGAAPSEVFNLRTNYTTPFDFNGNGGDEPEPPVPPTPVEYTIFHYADGTTSKSADTDLSSSSYDQKKDLISIEIGSTVTRIGYYAFFTQTGLTSVTIPSNVTSIEDGAFATRADIIINLEHTVPISLQTEDTEGEKYPIYAFGMRDIESGSGSERSVLINVPESAYETYMSACTYDAGWMYYSSCIHESTQKTVFYYDDGTTSKSADTGLTYMSYDRHKILSSVEIGSIVNYINDSAFYNCGNLASVTISDSVESIGEEVFRGCAKLSFVIIPDSVKTIGNNTFNTFGDLTIRMVSTTPENYASVAFGPSSASGSGSGRTLIIEVPAGTINVYKNSEYPVWQNYKECIQEYE